MRGTRAKKIRKICASTYKPGRTYRTMIRPGVKAQWHECCSGCKFGQKQDLIVPGYFKTIYFCKFRGDIFRRILSNCKSYESNKRKAKS